MLRFLACLLRSSRHLQPGSPQSGAGQLVVASRLRVPRARRRQARLYRKWTASDHLFLSNPSAVRCAFPRACFQAWLGDLFVYLGGGAWTYVCVWGRSRMSTEKPELRPPATIIPLEESCRAGAARQPFSVASFAFGMGSRGGSGAGAERRSCGGTEDRGRRHRGGSCVCEPEAPLRAGLFAASPPLPRHFVLRQLFPNAEKGG